MVNAYERGVQALDDLARTQKLATDPRGQLPDWFQFLHELANRAADRMLAYSESSEPVAEPTLKALALVIERCSSLATAVLIADTVTAAREG